MRLGLLRKELGGRGLRTFTLRSLLDLQQMLI